MKTLVHLEIGKMIEFDIEDRKAIANTNLYETGESVFLKDNFFEHYIKIRMEVLIYEPTEDFVNIKLNEIGEKFIKKIGSKEIIQRIFNEYAQKKFENRCKNLILRMKEIETFKLENQEDFY